MMGLFRVLLVVGVLVKFWWVILLVLGVTVAGVVLWLWSMRLDERDRATHADRAALVARADKQHAWVLTGDDRGLYGDYPPSKEV
jgi:hypothetical protein